MKLNSDKWAKIGNDKIWETKTAKLFGKTIDNWLKFDEHLYNVCVEANRKLSALIRIRKFFNFHKTRVLIKEFFESQFKYYPLTWMFCSRNTNNKIKLLHEGVFRLVNDNYELPFGKLLEKTVFYCPSL